MTKIEWATDSWNPIRARRTSDGRIGHHCEHVSEGCRNCYAERLNRWRGTGLDYKPGHRQDIELYLDEKALRKPLGWRKPRRVFVCSMTDLFADFVPDEWIDKIMAVAALCPAHQFLMLTKRPERMRDHIMRDGYDYAGVLMDTPGMGARDAIRGQLVSMGRYEGGISWPLPSLWLGTSVEDQATADERIPILLETPAAIRWVSAEPLLGPINFAGGGTLDPEACVGQTCVKGKPRGGYYWLTERPCAVCELADDLGHPRTDYSHPINCGWRKDRGNARGGIDWVVVGGESGPNARPMHPAWARSIRDQCEVAGVPFFFKQWGEWVPIPHICVSSGDIGLSIMGRQSGYVSIHDQTGATMSRVGKKRAGRELDGRTWDEYPEVGR